MKLILLPGMDGTGLLFKPLLEELHKDINIQIITYPIDAPSTYSDLINYVKDQLPKDEEYGLVAESFSGPIAYSLCTKPTKNLKFVIFVATFLTVPNKVLKFTSIFKAALPLRSFIPKFLVKYLLLGKDVDENGINLFYGALLKVPTNTLFTRLKEMAELERPRERILVPCTYLHANNDKLISKSCVNEFKALCQNINIISLEGPHFILQAKPKECARVLNKLIAI